MLRLLCRENNLEYTGDGYLQCCRNINCPKTVNNRILGFDCITYIDNLPEGYKVDIPERCIKDGTGMNPDATDTGGQKTETLAGKNRVIEYVVV